MLMFLGFIVLIACLVIGVRRGGIGLATISGIGLVFFIFVMGLKPGKPPVDVMLTIMAVVTCSAFLQASKGLDVMLKYAEKFLRSNPKYITILAPLTTWLLAVLCGTGHVVFDMFPIIYDIAIKQNIRPERPMSGASIASQMGVCASPASVAVVSVVAILGATDHPFGVMQILSISIPATFIGVVIAGLWSINRGKDLDKDSEFQEKIADPEQKEFIYGGLQEQSLLNIILPKSAYQAALVFLLGIVVIAIFGSFPQLLPHFPNAKGVLKPFSMTPTIQLMMLSIAAVIMILCNVLFLVSKLINSQAAAVTVIVPMALSVGVDPLVIVGFMPAAYGYFVLPTYPSDLACIGFDRSGTTHIGKFIINHSFLVPGLIGVGSACFAGYMLVHMVY